MKGTVSESAEPDGVAASTDSSDSKRNPRGVVERGGIMKRRITAYLDQELGQAAVMEAARRGVEIDRKSVV